MHQTYRRETQSNYKIRGRANVRTRAVIKQQTQKFQFTITVRKLEWNILRIK